MSIIEHGHVLCGFVLYYKNMLFVKWSENFEIRKL